MKINLNCNKTNIANQYFHPHLLFISRQNRKIILSLMLLLTVVYSGFSSGCGPKKVDYKEVSLSSTKEQMVETIGSEPNEEIKEEDGSTSFIYKKSQLLSYVGTMTYHYQGDVFLYTRWDYTNKKEDAVQKAYEEICNKYKKELGKGTENTELHSTNFITDSKNVIVAYGQEEEKWKLSVTTMMK